MQFLILIRDKSSRKFIFSSLLKDGDYSWFKIEAFFREQWTREFFKGKRVGHIFSRDDVLLYENFFDHLRDAVKSWQDQNPRYRVDAINHVLTEFNMPFELRLFELGQGDAENDT